jgi:hypothetical protein
MRRNLANLSATVNTTLSGESLTSSGKFANVVDSVMSKGRIGRMLQKFVSNTKIKKTKE